MPTVQIGMRSAFLLFGLLALAGCAGNQATPPVMPTIDEGIATQNKLATIKDPPGFFRANAAQIIANCGSYFDQLVAIAQKNAQGSSQVTAATQALSAILGLAQAAPGPISVLGVVGPAITGAIANAQAGAPGGDHPAEMSTLVAAEMSTYLAAIGNPPTDAPSAWLAAYGLFRTCSPAGIEAAKQQALADAPNHIAVVASPSSIPAAPQALAPLAAPSAPVPSMGVPLVRVHTPPPAPAMVAQAIPDAQIRKMRAEWRAIQRKGGRNAAEGGPRALPDIPHSVIDPPRTDVPSPLPAPPVADLEPPPARAVAPVPPAVTPPKRKL
jgi:hypothetical protein